MNTRAPAHPRQPAPRRILYLQFTNPAGYPPLLHSSRILADQGWEVAFLSTRSFGTANLRLPSHPRIQENQLGDGATGWEQRVRYGRFCLWGLARSARWKPHWLYASDPLSAPAALWLSRLFRIPVVYHEHDTPVVHGCRGLILKARRALARQAQLCILPNRGRAERFQRATGRKGACLTVWNCPSRTEALLPALRGAEFILHYHGNLGPELVPLTILDALLLAPGIRLELVGYATRGHESYPAHFLAEAARRKLSDRVRLSPAMPRAEMLCHTRQASLGLALMPMNSANPNFHTMVGASNKPFEYLASGVPLLMSALPDWQTTFERPCYGLTCDPRDPESIARALRWAGEHRTAARLMGELGRQRILNEWHYERQFEPVLRELACVKHGRAGRARPPIRVWPKPSPLEPWHSSRTAKFPCPFAGFDVMRVQDKEARG